MFHPPFFCLHRVVPQVQVVVQVVVQAKLLIISCRCKWCKWCCSTSGGLFFGAASSWCRQKNMIVFGVLLFLQYLCIVVESLIV